MEEEEVEEGQTSAETTPQKEKIQTFVLPHGLEYVSLEEESKWSDKYYRLAKNVTQLQLDEFLTLNPRIRNKKNVILRNGDLLVYIEEYVASPIHTEVIGELFATIRNNRNTIEGVTLIARMEADVPGAANDLYYSDVGVLAIEPTTNRRRLRALIEVSYSTGLQDNINRIVDFMNVSPHIGAGYVIAIRYPWSSVFVPLAEKSFYSLNNGMAIWVSINRRHEGVAAPFISDIVSFGKLPLELDDLESICDISFECFGVVFPENQIRGNISNRQNIQPCNAENIPQYQVHIPGEIFLVDHWVEDGVFAQAVVEAVPQNAGDLTLDLFRIQQSMNDGAEYMNETIERGAKTVSIANSRW